MHVAFHPSSQTLDAANNRELRTGVDKVIVHSLANWIGQGTNIYSNNNNNNNNNNKNNKFYFTLLHHLC